MNKRLDMLIEKYKLTRRLYDDKRRRYYFEVWQSEEMVRGRLVRYSVDNQVGTSIGKRNEYIFTRSAFNTESGEWDILEREVFYAKKD